ncbi:RNA polymerase sigma factor [Streptomyces sp. NPDC093568]|uniref:RNA polymerase sigma factor n=1 Tax=Streptomyces sp. NPDC093568 TaxID=3366041 RepID=UPI00380AB5ED
MPSAREDEFVAFFRRELPLLIRHLTIRGFDTSAAKEAAQEAMVELHEQWEVVAHPTTWVRLVAIRRAIRGQNQEIARRKVVSAMAAVSYPDVDLRTPEEQVTRQQELEEVVGLLRTLPDVQRQIVAWTWDGATPAEIARHLGTSPETVRSNLRHARNRLKQLWAKSRKEESNDG